MRYLFIILLVSCTETIIQSEYWDGSITLDLQSWCQSRGIEYYQSPKPMEYESNIYIETDISLEKTKEYYVIDSGYVVKCKLADQKARQIIRWKY